MGLALKGISKLSELLIDADKDWQAKGITNIKEVAALMTTGSLVMHNGNLLVPFYPSLDGYVCTSQGPLKALTWAPAGGTLKYWFPISIASVHAEAVVPVDQSYNKNAPLTTENKQAYLDAPGDMIKRLDHTVALADAEAIVVAAANYNKNVPVGRDISILIDGCVYEPNGGPQVDQTANARSVAVNDVILNPMTPIAGDMVYFGFRQPFARMWFYLSTQGAGNWTNIYEYWNGAWVAVVGEDDQSSEWQATAGIHRIQHTPQGDWVASIIMGMNLFWIRSITTAFVNQITAPLGAQANCCLVV